MKLNKIKFAFLSKNILLAIIYIFLISNCNVIAVKSNIALSKISAKHYSLHKSHKTHRGHKSKTRHSRSHTAFDMKACPQPKFDFVSFLIGIKTGYSMTITDHIAGVIMEDVLKANTASEQCKQVLSQAYNQGVREAEKQVKNYVDDGINRDLEQLNDLGLKDDERAHAGTLRENPKRLCEYLREKISEKLVDTGEEKEKLNKMMDIIDDFY